jgi:hypothetical protein
MNLNTACKPRQSVFDRSRKDVVLNIDDLLKQTTQSCPGKQHDPKSNMTRAGKQC